MDLNIWHYLFLAVAFIALLPVIANGFVAGMIIAAFIILIAAIVFLVFPKLIGFGKDTFVSRQFGATAAKYQSDDGSVSNAGRSRWDRDNGGE